MARKKLKSDITLGVKMNVSVCVKGTVEDYIITGCGTIVGQKTIELWNTKIPNKIGDLIVITLK